MAGEQTMVTAKNVTKYYGLLRAVDDISFELHKGEVLADGAAAQLLGQMRASSMRAVFETLVQEREAA